MAMMWQLARTYARVAWSNRGAYALAQRARRGIPREKWVGEFTTPVGVRLNLDLGTYPDCNMALGLYESETARVIQRMLKPGATFVDCGANIGYFTLLASRCVGAGGKVHAFEPDPVNRTRLQEHLQMNGAGNVLVHPEAVSDRTEELDFFHPSGALNHGQASRYSSLVPEGEKYKVTARRLDEVINEPVDLIKMDVEGAELSALKGVEKLLTSNRPPAIIVEHNQETALAAGFKASEIFDLLVKMQPRYRVYWIGARLKEIKGGGDLDGIARQGNLLVRMQ